MNPAHWTRVVKQIRERYGYDRAQAKQVFDKLRETEGRTPSLRMVGRLPDRLPKALKPPKAQAPPAPAPAPRKATRKAPEPVPAPAPRKASRKAPEPPKLSVLPTPPRRQAPAKKGKKKPSQRPRRIADTPADNLTSRELIQAQRSDLEREINRGQPGGRVVRLAPVPVERPRGIAREVPTRQGARNKFEALLRERGLPVSAIARQGVGKDITRLWRDSKLQTKVADALARAYRDIEESKNGKVRMKTRERLEKLFSTISKNNEGRAKILWHAIMKQLYGSK